MRAARTYRPLDYRQTCAIAKLVLLRDPAATYGEWAEATKCEAARQGYATPLADPLTRAMKAVERSLEAVLGPRPIRELAPSGRRA